MGQRIGDIGTPAPHVKFRGKAWESAGLARESGKLVNVDQEAGSDDVTCDTSPTRGGGTRGKPDPDDFSLPRLFPREGGGPDQTKIVCERLDPRLRGGTIQAGVIPLYPASRMSR